MVHQDRKLTDCQSLLEVVQKELARAERDNDLIYHKDVPAVSDLVAIPEVKLVSAIGASGLIEPRSLVPHGEALFSELVSWGVKAAISKTLYYTAIDIDASC